MARRVQAGPRVCAGAVLLVVFAALAGCGGPAATRATSPAPDLSDRLDAMAPQAQLDTLRILEQAAPDDPRLVLHIGNAYYALGAAEPAERHSRAVAYYDSAVAAYQRAAELDTTYSRAYVNMGLAYDGGGHRNEARAAFQHALAIDPRDVLAYCHLGFLEQSMGNRDEAMTMYQQALAIDPNSAQAHYNLGLAFAETRIFREALKEWELAAKADPDGEIGKAAGENANIIRQYLAETP
ncbi:MAG TPA: tetratricopeptide repeat protein [Candidatus Krumholzibacteria bacterium]|nr:tetratricopeptide repeat protein [Candidatus Krumholzibacteria bacterium]